ncbi:MAG: hypothetical protein A3F98_00620 [Candidatus Yanofskybacteria bacterium RIFCSPLOWO2_12_FULL_41_8]|uniref:CAAX prenyl protease 2/Lysostaphin resistance protein A-like domain-containing protein n=1 Tax=Candidatus Yanofskybacteria bacterium RIFCSPHIGHO2_01_FULL_41_53 TaxID=1802663 RepID=A0A1F8EM54_9BACT|nr:MAG: hypothetical protein A2650_00405 [Candidatus Yanofskybacteria bacterium RIFCSPHIGHO2_01_FULL_41_53]OGN17025.1 MAG: hypothetical protein A3F48_03705 [Candidatus Yanofskybacteria bacterium RIFCSPHIGHO2_12_FULL_41_9]OGN23613.1 MAG: hypothetical protein A2916_01480 [Candidatus Yanofskybacteria bacterium RIFCSPLOWO2_01_FULL_41_67]OGN29400.1 MAG: hypothetical protein A3H54_04045 [Candidatus Yanofskybacteria bacterium RIFCSPLOWO2_02_FULL_41_13]OGN34553.1 MAG: hypothetical protein A3F98_00620 [
MLAHLLETRGRYEDGTSRTYTKHEIYNTGLGGIFYGVIVVTTGSLWPSIFLHIMWNLFVMLPFINKDKLIKFSKSLQR